MSLTARIALDPSRPIAWAERSVPLAGLTLATVTLVARWPDHAFVWLACAVLSAIACVAIDLRRVRQARALTLDVSDRSDIDVRTASASGGFRLAESTVVWPGFAMLALARDGESRVAIRRAVVVPELRATDRRALQRFLLWSLRARGSHPADRKPGA